MDKVAFIGDDAEKLMHTMTYDCFGTPFNQTAFDLVHFNTQEKFVTDYNARPMEWYAAIGDVVVSDAEDKKSVFTIFHNETMKNGRYVPNYDEDTLEKKDPSFVFVPVLTARGAALNYGDNRLADLQYRTQFALSKIVQGKWNSSENPYDSLLFSHGITAKTHPFKKPQCDGVGCAMKFIMPQLICWIFMITMQSMLTSLGLEKERSIKESLLLSGMSQTSYFGSWFLSKTVDAIPPALVWTAGAYALQCIEYQSFLPVLLVTFCYALQMICFSLFMQTMFKTSSAMFMASLLLLLVFSLCYYPIRLLGFDKDPSVVDHEALTITFLLPAVSICHYYWELVEAEGMKVMLDYNDPTNYVVRAIWMQVVSCVFWFLLFMYFEQIMPQAHGPAHQDHPLFCFRCKSTKSDKIADCGQGPVGGNDDDDVEMTATKNDDEENDTEKDSNKKKINRSQYRGISVRNLVKEFTVSAAAAKEGMKGKEKKNGTEETKDDMKETTLRAIDGLNCDFAQGTITAVLGHNVSFP